MIKKITKKILAVVFWIVIWHIFALTVDSELLVPSPLSVLVRLAQLCVTSEFWITVATSLLRITMGILISIVVGVLLGVLCFVSDFAKTLISPIMSLVKATPVASFIMLALLWIDRGVLPMFIAVLIVVPVVTANITEGMGSVDKNLAEVAKVFKFSFFKKVKHLYLPSVYPYFISSCRSSLGLAWKAGIAAEVLAVPVFSIGKMIYDSKLYLETTDLFAWTVVVVVLSAVIEYLFCMAFKSYERQVTPNA